MVPQTYVGMVVTHGYVIPYQWFSFVNAWVAAAIEGSVGCTTSPYQQYQPINPIRINGAGISTATLMNIESGGSLTLESGATLDVNSGATVSYGGNLSVGGILTIETGGGFVLETGTTGSISSGFDFESGAETTWLSGSQLVVANGGAVSGQNGSTWTWASTATTTFNNTPTFPGGIGGNVDVGGALTIGGLASLDGGVAIAGDASVSSDLSVTGNVNGRFVKRFNSMGNVTVSPTQIDEAYEVYSFDTPTLIDVDIEIEDSTIGPGVEITVFTVASLAFTYTFLDGVGGPALFQFPATATDRYSAKVVWNGVSWIVAAYHVWTP